jgi:pimeloyl-ACP methyl ester carboxylesterase
MKHYNVVGTSKIHNDAKLDLLIKAQLLIDKEIKTFGRYAMKLWFDVQPQLFHLRHKFQFKLLKERYRHAKRDRILQLIIGARIVDNDLIANNFEDVSTEHKKIADAKRESNYIKNMLQFSPNRVEDKKYLDRGNMIPIIFEETVIKPPAEFMQDLISSKNSSRLDSTSMTLASNEASKQSNQKSKHVKHRPTLTPKQKQQILDDAVDPLLALPELVPRYPLFPGTQQDRFSLFGSLIVHPDPYSSKPLELVILCHGLQGTHLDMMKTKHYLCMSNSSIEVVCSRANEDQTTKDIAAMGINLADEVHKLVSSLTSTRKLLSISFVGHSLGGLIIRSALPHLERYQEYFKCLVTMSTPHLGVAAGDSKLVETGFSLLTSWAKHLSMEQLGLKDTSDPYNSFIYRLSMKPGLEWFQEVILVSSPQDTYSPFDSSRVQVSMKNTSNLKYAQTFVDMVDNILGRIKSQRLRRVDICLKFPKSNLDTFLGRAAHIAMINDGVLLEMLSYRYSHLL